MFVAALLQSEDSSIIKTERKFLKKVLQCIQEDDILSEWINLVNVDDDYSQSILDKNASGVSVDHLPAFAIRDDSSVISSRTGQSNDFEEFEKSCPKIYDIFQANKVFEKVYDAHYQLLRKQNKKCRVYKPPTVSLPR